MAKYVKKPIPIEARQYKDESILEFTGENGFIDYVNRLCINTLNGLVICRKGEYIIKGVDGEFYPISESLFKKTYKEYKKPRITMNDVYQQADKIRTLYNNNEAEVGDEISELLNMIEEYDWYHDDEIEQKAMKEEFIESVHTRDDEE